jgi:heme-degrading monooxygenase HmoA
MHVRVITFIGAKNIDDGLIFLREKVMPVVSGQQGYAGLTASADRQGGVFGILSLWETEADRHASEQALAGARQEALDIMGGEMTVENFEQVVIDMAGTPPGPGAALLVQRASMDPGKMDENLAFFKSEVAPLIKANPGFRALRQLVNRETGEAIVGTVWADTDSLRAALAQGQQRRQEAGDRGVSFGEFSEREILFTDLPY